MSSVFGSSRYENEVTKGFSIGHSIANVEPKQGKAQCLNGRRLFDVQNVQEKECPGKVSWCLSVYLVNIKITKCRFKCMENGLVYS